jgi:hypothetical protein
MDGWKDGRIDSIQRILLLWRFRIKVVPHAWLRGSTMVVKKLELQISPGQLILDCPWIRAVASKFSLSVSLQTAPLQVITSVDASFIITNIVVMLMINMMIIIIIIISSSSSSSSSNIVINSVLPCRRLSVFSRDIRDYALVTVCPIKITLLIDALGLRTLFLGTLTFFESKLFVLIIVCSGTFSSIKILTVLIVYIYFCFTA